LAGDLTLANDGTTAVTYTLMVLDYWVTVISSLIRMNVL
jgi:hypothetical protein